MGTHQDLLPATHFSILGNTHNVKTESNAYSCAFYFYVLGTWSSKFLSVKLWLLTHIYWWVGTKYPPGFTTHGKSTACFNPNILHIGNFWWLTASVYHIWMAVTHAPGRVIACGYPGHQNATRSIPVFCSLLCVLGSLEKQICSYVFFRRAEWRASHGHCASAEGGIIFTRLVATTTNCVFAWNLPSLGEGSKLHCADQYMVPAGQSMARWWDISWLISRYQQGYPQITPQTKLLQDWEERYVRLLWKKSCSCWGCRPRNCAESKRCTAH